VARYERGDFATVEFDSEFQVTSPFFIQGHRYAFNAARQSKKRLQLCCQQLSRPCRTPDRLLQTFERSSEIDFFLQSLSLKAICPMVENPS
jgi:hypothetical protein